MVLGQLITSPMDFYVPSVCVRSVRRHFAFDLSFFFGFYKSRKRKLHYHDARSEAIALVKVARPRCRALAFISCWPTLVSVQS
jgi:hypothetical protein